MCILIESVSRLSKPKKKKNRHNNVVRSDLNRMQKIFITLVLLLSYSGCTCSNEYQAQNGDIIFQTSQSSQSVAIQRATKSKYSHMGIVYIKNSQPFVFEAIGRDH